MIRNTFATTDLLAATPSSANVVKTVVYFSDKTATAYTGGNEVHSLAAAAKATICGTPASGDRDIDHAILCATGGANTITIEQTVSGTDYQLTQAVLATNETLEYTHAGGWRTLDANGQEKLAMPGYLPLAGGTMTGDLLFTDASYDIGASGATRPRDLFLSRNAVIGGTLNVTGTTTLGTTNTGTLTASLIQASASGNVDCFASTSNATTNRRVFRLTNAGGGALFGVDDSVGGNFIFGSSAYDAGFRGETGISFSANAGSNLHGRISSSGAWTTNGGSFTAGAIICTSGTFSSLGAFATNDKYVIVDASGHLHVSSLGPLS